MRTKRTTAYKYFVSYIVLVVKLLHVHVSVTSLRIAAIVAERFIRRRFSLRDAAETCTCGRFISL